MSSWATKPVFVGAGLTEGTLCFLPSKTRGGCTSKAKTDVRKKNLLDCGHTEFQELERYALVRT